MRVIHTYPHNGKTVTLHEDSRFPDGPISNSDEDVRDFLEFNISAMKEVAKAMEANADRQKLIVEIQNQTAYLSKVKGRITERIRRAKDQIKR